MSLIHSLKTSLVLLLIPLVEEYPVYKQGSFCDHQEREKHFRLRWKGVPSPVLVQSSGSECLPFRRVSPFLGSAPVHH